MIKLLIVGNSNAGKTQLLNRFVSNRFEEKHMTTIACDFAQKILRIDGNEIRLQMWDLQGQDHMVNTMGGITKTICRKASGALVVADITDIQSIENTASWKEQIEQNMSQAIHQQYDYYNQQEQQ